jgi:transposase
VFTTATLPNRAYAAKGDNITLEEKLTSSPAVAVVAGVSAEMGLEAFFIHARSIDSDSFIQYLLVLLDSSKASEFVIFLDNCRVHHSKKVDQFLKENKIEVIFNVPYGPEYNPIETESWPSSRPSSRRGRWRPYLRRRSRTTRS